MRTLARLITVTCFVAGCESSPTLPPVAEEDYAAACARISACDPDGIGRLGQNMCYLLPFMRGWFDLLSQSNAGRIAALDCALAANDCEGVRACTPDPAPFASVCSDQLPYGHCVGDTWVVCQLESSQPELAIDCGAMGQVCGGDGPRAGCGSAKCDPSTYVTTCEGDTWVHCTEGGVVERSDCAINDEMVVAITAATGGGQAEVRYTLAGETCGMAHGDFEGQYRCVGRGAECDEFEQTCEGDVLQTCTGGRISRRDCAKQWPGGLTCGIVSGYYDCGVADGACEPADAESCSDGVVTYCALSKPATLDCRALGYSGCATATTGGRTVAYCTP